jgi:hypothetical protein
MDSSRDNLSCFVICLYLFVKFIQLKKDFAESLFVKNAAAEVNKTYEAWYNVRNMAETDELTENVGVAACELMSSESNMKTDLADTCQGVDGNQHSWENALCIQPFYNTVLDDVCCCSSFRQMHHHDASVVRTCQDLPSIGRLQCDLSPGLPGPKDGYLIEDAFKVDPSVDNLNSCLMVTGDLPEVPDLHLYGMPIPLMVISSLQGLHDCDGLLYCESTLRRLSPSRFSESYAQQIMITRCVMPSGLRSPSK